MTTISRNFRRPTDHEFVFEQLNRLGNTRHLSHIYGGYVRDLLRKQPFQDIDIWVPCLETAQGFIQAMTDCQRILSLTTKRTTEEVGPEDYQHFTMVIQAPRTAELKIDITYSAATVLEENSTNNVEFTMNNLMIDQHGNLKTRVPARKIGLHHQYSEIEWLAKCVQDCYLGNLVWMVPDRFSQRLSISQKTFFMEKMNMRLNKMLSKGFVETGEYLTSFRLLKLRPVLSLSVEMEATMCAICHENYKDTSDESTVVSKCSHHFHRNCIKQWITKNNQEQIEPTCPCCRDELVLYY